MTIDSATLMGLAEHPGHLDGYGPIPPVMARRIAAGGDWHRLVTDAVTGALLDYGRTAYRPPAELADFVTARDRTCRFPTCSRAARLCDIDHAEPYDHAHPDAGGATSSANCGAACRRNHRQKTAGDVLLISHPDGSATWTTKSGHTYHRPAIDHCPEHTAHLKDLRERAAAQVNRVDYLTPIVMHEPHDLDDPDDELPTTDPTATRKTQGADDSTAIAHDSHARDQPPDEPHTGTHAGNDPPTT
ncbi:MAG: HNH endonuclease signature motif containing protein [Mycobacteriales bacterium]